MGKGTPRASPGSPPGPPRGGPQTAPQNPPGGGSLNRRGSNIYKWIMTRASQGDGTGSPHASAWVWWLRCYGKMHRIG